MIGGICSIRGMCSEIGGMHSITCDRVVFNARGRPLEGGDEGGMAALLTTFTGGALQESCT